MPTLALVMPAWNAAHLLPQSLGRIMEVAAFEDVVVVNPGSTDDTAGVARELGAKVIDLGHRAGPAEARNRGVEATTADVVLFVDSDCIMAEDVPGIVRAAFCDPHLVTLTGSYDDTPPENNLASLYMNLRHHYTHQNARREGATFWAGCGAVRRDIFLKVGGFDAVRFPRPMIEDIELGLRMAEYGATRLDPDLHATHLKRWSLCGVIHTDIFCRAIPWTRLILERGEAPDDLNLRTSQRVGALLAPLALMSLVALPFWKCLPPWCQAAAPLILLGSILVNFGLLRFFWRSRGMFFACDGWFLHQLHLFYSAVVFVLIQIDHRLRGGGAKKP